MQDRCSVISHVLCIIQRKWLLHVRNLFCWIECRVFICNNFAKYIQNKKNAIRSFKHIPCQQCHVKEQYTELWKCWMTGTVWTKNKTQKPVFFLHEVWYTLSTKELDKVKGGGKWSAVNRNTLLYRTIQIRMEPFYIQNK